MQKELDTLLELIELEPETAVTINLENQLLTILNASISYSFAIDQFRKACLINGVDELGYLLTLDEKITEYEAAHPTFISSGEAI